MWVAGKKGKALEFNGTDSYVDCGKDESLNLPTGGAVTMCAWVNSKVGSTGAWQAIMAKRDGASYSYGINLITNNFQVYTSGASGIQGFAYNLPVDEWVFVCGIMSEDPTALYIDGELFGAKGPGGGVSAIAANPLTLAESFGAAAAFGNAEIFNGIIDEVAVFNVVLTENDMKDIMTKGLRVAPIPALMALDQLHQCLLIRRGVQCAGRSTQLAQSKFRFHAAFPPFSVPRVFDLNVSAPEQFGQWGVYAFLTCPLSVITVIAGKLTGIWRWFFAVRINFISAWQDLQTAMILPPMNDGGRNARPPCELAVPIRTLKDFRFGFAPRCLPHTHVSASSLSRYESPFLTNGN